MPLQNRVNPEGEICVSAARGTLMGNRGTCMHNEKHELAYPTRVKSAWITCLLEFKNEKRELMAPGLYTELFFLDEATALAAGHRPCAQCRREDYKRFLAAWTAGNCPGKTVLAPDMDAALKQERTNAGRHQTDALTALPDGVMVKQAVSGSFFLIRGGKLYKWAFKGYGPAHVPNSVAGPFLVLTPDSTMNAIRAGYSVGVHQTAL